MRNGVKNGQSTQFSSENQPSSEAKSGGWHRRRLAQDFMNKVFEMQEMTIEEFEQMELDMSKTKQSYTMQDLMAMNYIRSMVNSDKLILDWLDRHIGKAPKYEDEEKNKPKIDKVVVEIINTHKGFDEAENIIDLPS